MNHVISSVPHVPPFALQYKEMDRVVPLENPWIQAGFCDEMGKLTYEPQIQTQFLDQEAMIKLERLLHKTIRVDRVELTLKKYLNRIIAQFPYFSFELCLRGSYAAYVFNPLETLRALVDDFIQQHPEQRPLMLEGLKRIEAHIPPLSEPNDSDWTLLGNIPLNPEQQAAIRSGLIEIHAELAGVSQQEAEATTFQSLFLPRSTQWTDLNDPIVISTVGGDHIKLDLVTGFLQEAPYLFSHDNRFIRIAKMPYVKVLQGNVFQSALDYGLNIIRFEKRHVKDFRALLKAIYHLTCGKKWDECVVTAKEILRHFLCIPTDEISRFILKWLDGKKVDRISFVVNFLCLVDNEVQRNELWQHLSDGKISFSEASRQIFERKQAFPEAYGAMPMLKRDSDGPIIPSIDFKKRALFIPLRTLEEEPAGIYAEWRKGCELLHEKKPVPCSFIEEIATLFLAHKFSPAEEAILAKRLLFPLFIDALVALGPSDPIHQEWLRAHHEESWDEKLKRLPSPLNPATKSFLMGHCPTVKDPKELFLAAMRCRIFQPENKCKELFITITVNDHENSVIALLGKIGTSIALDNKDWIIDLWIECVQKGRVSLRSFNDKIPHWLNGKIPEIMKQRIALNIIQAFGIASLDAVDSLCPHIAHVEAAVLMQGFLKSLEKSIDAASVFYCFHQEALTPYLDDLFIQAAERQLALPFVKALETIVDMRSLIMTNLSKIPPASRLACVQQLPRSDHFQCVQKPHLLSSEDRQNLGTRLVNDEKSIFDLWVIQGWGIHIPEKLIHSIHQTFYPQQNLKGDRVKQTALSLIDSLHIDALELLVPRLEQSLKEEMQPFFRKRIEQALTQIALHEIAAVLKSKELTEWSLLTPQDLEGLKIAPALANDLLQSITDIRRPSPQNLVLCMHYIRLTPNAFTNTKLCTQIFSWAPHKLPHELGNLLAKASVANPHQYAKALNAHAPWLVSLTAASGETLYQLFTVLIALRMPLPKEIPPSIVEYLTQIPFTETMKSVTIAVLHVVCIPALLDHFLNHQNPDHPVTFDDVISFSIPDARILSPLFSTKEALTRSLPSFLQHFKKGKSSNEGMLALLEIVLRRCLECAASDLIQDELNMIERSIKDETLRKEMGQIAIQRYLTCHHGGYRWLKYADSVETCAQIISIYKEHDQAWHSDPEAVRALLDIVRYLSKNTVVEETSASNFSIAQNLIALLSKRTHLARVESYPEVLDLLTLYTRHKSWSAKMQLELHLIIATIAPQATAQLAFLAIAQILCDGLVLPPDQWKRIVPLQYRFKDITLPLILVKEEMRHQPGWEDLREEYLNLEYLIRFILEQECHLNEERRKENLFTLLAWAEKNQHLHDHPVIYADIVALEILRDIPNLSEMQVIAITPDVNALIFFWLGLDFKTNPIKRPLALLRDRLLANTSPTKFELVLQVLCQITRNEFTTKHKNQALYERDYKDLMHALFAHPHFHLDRHLVAMIQTGLLMFKDTTDIYFYTHFLGKELSDKKVIDTFPKTHTKEDVHRLLTKAMDIAHRRIDQTGFIWSQHIAVHACHYYPKNKSRIGPFLTKLFLNLMHNKIIPEVIETQLTSIFDKGGFSSGMQLWLRHFIEENKQRPLPELIPMTANDFE